MDSLELKRSLDLPFETGTTTTDKGKISTITSILNKANEIPKNVEYKFSSEPTYKIQLIYKDGNAEIIIIYEDFDKNTTLLSSDLSGYYKINQKQTEKIKILLLNK